MNSNPLRLVAGLAVLVAACAGERDPINRVQPWALDKAFFVGADLQSTADDPEFWAQGTIVDVGYGASQDGLFTSTYAQPLTRIKWDIQEDKLIARLTYELIADSDGKGVGPTSKDGQVVAVYRILKHFDIQREYNASTGEEINVIGENASDRPWFERQHFRVDFSQNLFTDAYELDTLSMLGIYGSIKYEPVAYTVNDENDRDAPRFDLDSGYFDVTNKVFARPGMIDLRHFGWGIDAFPACWLDNDFMSGTAPSGNCNPVELTLRQSYRRVVETDYEPAEWDGHRFQSFGAFTNERKGYSRNYGMSDEKWHRLINRFDIWEDSHYYADPKARTGAVPCFTPETTPAGADPHRDLDLDGTEDECAQVGRGSQCDTFNQKCTLPYRDRVATPLAWYYTDDSNYDYFEGSDWATHDWDVALRSAVVTARYSECKRTGGDQCDTLYPVYRGQQDDNGDALSISREVDDCRHGRAYFGEDCNAVADRLGGNRSASPGVVFVAKQPEMVVLCHSPVQANDPAACQGPRLPSHILAADCQSPTLPADRRAACDAAFSVRPGDLRYHQVNVIRTPQTPSPWGIMVDAVDPLTGEKVSASINVWSHVTDLWTQGIIDLARYVKGELTTEDVTEGTFIHEWARASEAAGAGGLAGRLTKEELDERIAGYLGLDALQLEEARHLWENINPSLKHQVKELAHAARDVRADATVVSGTRALSTARRDRVVGTDFEAQFSRSVAMQQLAGVSGASKLSEDTRTALASPFRVNDLRVVGELHARRELALAERGACIMRETPMPVGIAALASTLEEKFGAFNPTDPKEKQLERAEKMRRWLAQRAHYAVMAHEMGHSIGLRHNFVSSSDAFNYRPQYWQLRTENGSATRECTTLEADGECVGPRYFDPVNANEAYNLQWMFMQSSVMDYAGEPLQDLVGLGAYDFAATRMFYGESVAVYTDPSYRQNATRGAGVLDKMDGFGGILGFQYQLPTTGQSSTIHYSQLQKHYELIKDCVPVDPELFRPAAWNAERDGAWHPVVDGLIVNVNGQWTRCRQQPVDYVSWTSMRDATGAGKTSAVDATGRTRVPYGFATDRWADLGNLSVYRHDNGADPYELFDFLITQQEVNHVFDNYRRGKQSFSVRSAAGRTLNRYNSKMRDAAKGLGLLVNIYRDFSLEVGYDFDTLWPALSQQLFGPNILASGIAFDHFARQLQRPQAGRHYLDAGVLRAEDDSYGDHSAAQSVIVPNGATGHMTNVSFGGRPLENSLATDRGEYDSDYTLWAGSYYDKAYTSMLMTESVDNFISSSRNDFLDARFRAVSLADVFPEGYRRWLANNLTGDAFIKGARVASTAAGVPLVDADGYPAAGIGWTSWWPAAGPRSCFTGSSSLNCVSSPANTLVLDPQVGWEQQKFLIAWTLQYLPENEQQTWLNQLNIWEIGADNDPGFDGRIELHDPAGRTFVARTFGTETLFGKTVQKGISARMLEYANELLEKAYVVTPGATDANDVPLWWKPVLNADGTPIVKYDPSISAINPQGAPEPSGRPGCNAGDNSKCTCASNRSCIAYNRYVELPVFLRQAMRAYGLADPSMRGIY